MIASALSVPLLLSAVTLSTPTVPATGRATALVTLDRPAMVRLTATSPSGTSCELVDKVRGPFAQDGQAGRRNCKLDLLLDQGSYKVRLESSRRGKGKARIGAAEFQELNPTPQRLVPGSLTQLQLKSGQQASYWLHLTNRDAPNLRVSGRNAGDVRLWRNGQWVEPGSLVHEDYSPEPGRPIHEWWLASPLEEGDYLVTVYGTQEHEWPGGAENDALELELGFRNGPPEEATAFTLGRSGIATVRIPAERWMAMLTLDVAPSAAVELVVDGVATHGDRCRIEKKALVPQCAVTAYGTTAPHVLMVRGPAGTKGMLEWAPAGARNGRGGYYGSATNQMPFNASPGISVVTLHDLPADTDAAPLGCVLTNVKGDRLAWDFPHVGGGKKLDVQFNYDGATGMIWFDVDRGGKYHIETTGGRKSKCELYRFVKEADVQRLSQTQPDAKACALDLVLSEGSHQLSLFDGLEGVEHLVIVEAGHEKDAKPIPAKASCLLPAAPLGSGHVLLTNRTGAITARGLIVEPLPLALSHPLHLTLDPGAKVSLPLSALSGTLVRSAAGAPFKCAGIAASGGECHIEKDKLELENPGDAPIGVVVLRPGAAAAPAPLETYAPRITPLPAAKADVPMFFDFAASESHSVVFDVDKPGLYNVSTQGLLATSCALRTPVIPNVANDTSSGRGRNCLVAGYLRPGKYMMTVSTVAPSRGRASVLLTRRPLREQATVTADGEAFFRVDPGDLVQQKLVVGKAGTYELATTAQGAGGALRCRIDDAEGWPLTTVPTSCSGTRSLAKGVYLWTQLPLTVESMRHTKIAAQAAPLVLKGNKPHPVDFFTWYQAHLGSDGKDEFTFKLDGPADVDIVLTKGMQGRLYEGAKPIDVIPPTETTEAPPEQADTTESEPAPETEPQDYRECEDCTENEGETPQAPAVQPVAAEEAPRIPHGKTLSLEAGSYRLVTEHSRGDVAIDYQLHVGSTVLMPGMARALPTPARLPISVPHDGTLRIRTSGEADVRCRLFDSTGHLVLEGSENGADWNCAIAEPIAHGLYTLVLESETQSRSETKLSLALAAVEDKGAVTDGATLKLGASVQTLGVPTGEGVQELGFKSKAPFSCALEDATGAVVLRRSRVSDCPLLVRTKNDKFRVRLWTTDGAAQVAASFKASPAHVAKIAAPGLYKTDAHAFCLPATQSGALRGCGPEVSLEAGDVVFASDVSPSELTLSDAKSWSAPLSKLPFIEAVTFNGVTLLEAHLQHGERVAPACGFATGGVRDARAYDCFAASAAGAKSIARLWTTDEQGVPANLKIRTVPVPAKRGLLKPGRQRLEWTGESGAWDMPAGRTRVTLTLAPGVWAVLQDAQGKALDLCAPTGDLSACAFTGAGGRVLLTGEKELRADASVVIVDSPERAVAFNGLYEDTPRTTGLLKLDVASSPTARTMVVEGAQRCVATLSDGMRLTGCRAEIGAGLSGELRVEHGAAPVRVMVFAVGRERPARLGLDLPVVPGAPLPTSTAVPLTQGRIDRTIIVDKDAVVRLSAESGVCGLFKGNDLLAVDGLDSGCEIVRLLSPGTYRVVVRPFGSYVVPGSLKWTAEPIVALKDGVGTEEWLSPSEARLYRFQTQSKGNIGFGVQTRDEALDCAIYDDGYKLLGEGCQQFLALEKGTYLLTVRLPQKPGASPLRFKPVLLGLAGAKADVPQAYLEDLFNRIGGRP